MGHARQVYHNNSVTRGMLGLIREGFLIPPRADEMYAEDIVFYDTLVGEYTKEMNSYINNKIKKGGL